MARPKVADWLIILALYAISYGTFLFNPGIFWDDWWLQGIPPGSFVDAFRDLGLVVFGSVHAAMALLGDMAPIGYRIGQFLCYLFPVFFLNDVLKSIDGVTQRHKFWILCIFAIYPVNPARISAINFPYALSYCLFFLGAALLARHLNAKGERLLRASALIVFLLAFNTNSTLVFYALVPMYLAYRLHGRITPSSLCEASYKYWDFFVLPPLFWALKQSFSPSYGRFVNYNKVQITAALPGYFLDSFYSAVITPVIGGFTDLSLSGVATIALLSIASGILLRVQSKRTQSSQGQSRTDSIGFAIGIAAIALALFPYVVVRALPTLDEWTSRHALLVPLGAALSLTYAASWIYQRLPDQFARGVAWAGPVLLSAFAVKNLSYGMDFQRDWQRQERLIRAFQKSPELRAASIVIFHDPAPRLNALKRTYRFYEVSGMMRNAYGDEKRLVITFGELEQYKRLGVDAYTQAHHSMIYAAGYGMREFNPRAQCECRAEVVDDPSLSETSLRIDCLDPKTQQKCP